MSIYGDLSVTQHPTIPNYEMRFERRYFEWALLGSKGIAQVERYSDWYEGQEVAYHEVLRFNHEAASGSYRVSLNITDPDKKTSVVKINAERNRQMEDGLYQPLADEIAAFYRSEAGQAAWKAHARAGYAQSIAELEEKIQMLREKIASLD